MMGVDRSKEKVKMDVKLNNFGNDGDEEDFEFKVD